MIYIAFFSTATALAAWTNRAYARKMAHDLEDWRSRKDVKH